MRTDQHRPSAIQTEDYTFVAFDCMKVEYGNFEVIRMNREFIQAHKARTGGDVSQHQHGGTCHICGSVNAIYTALFHHEKSNTYIRTGLDCASKLDSCDTQGFRRKVAKALEAHRGVRKAKAMLEQDGLEAAWNVYSGEFVDKYEERVIRDIVGNAVRYGRLSDAQIKYITSLVAKINNRGQIEAQRAVEAAVAKNVPVTEKRITVLGKVLSIKTVEGYYGLSTKLLVQHADGWKVYGSIFVIEGSIQRGDIVEFDAVVKVSDNDSKFGFYSRPTKGRVVKQEEVA